MQRAGLAGANAHETLVAFSKLVCADYLVKNSHVLEQHAKPAVDQLATAMRAMADLAASQAAAMRASIAALAAANERLALELLSAQGQLNVIVRAVEIKRAPPSRAADVGSSSGASASPAHSPDASPTSPACAPTSLSPVPASSAILSAGGGGASPTYPISSQPHSTVPTMPLAGLNLADLWSLLSRRRRPTVNFAQQAKSAVDKAITLLKFVATEAQTTRWANKDTPELEIRSDGIDVQRVFVARLRSVFVANGVDVPAALAAPATTMPVTMVDERFKPLNAKDRCIVNVLSTHLTASACTALIHELDNPPASGPSSSKKRSRAGEAAGAAASATAGADAADAAGADAAGAATPATAPPAVGGAGSAPAPSRLTAAWGGLFGRGTGR